MATDNVNQSGASAAADSAKEESAPLAESTGPDTAAVEPQAAAETTQTVPSAEAPTSESPEATPAASSEAEKAASPEPEKAASPEPADSEPSPEKAGRCQFGDGAAGRPPTLLYAQSGAVDGVLRAARAQLRAGLHAESGVSGLDSCH